VRQRHIGTFNTVALQCRYMASQSHTDDTLESGIGQSISAHEWAQYDELARGTTLERLEIRHYTPRLTAHYVSVGDVSIKPSGRCFFHVYNDGEYVGDISGQDIVECARGDS